MVIWQPERIIRKTASSDNLWIRKIILLFFRLHSTSDVSKDLQLIHTFCVSHKREAPDHGSLLENRLMCGSPTIVFEHATVKSLTPVIPVNSFFSNKSILRSVRLSFKAFFLHENIKLCQTKGNCEARRIFFVDSWIKEHCIHPFYPFGMIKLNLVKRKNCFLFTSHSVTDDFKHFRMLKIQRAVRLTAILQWACS